MRKVLLGFVFGVQLLAMADENQREPQNRPDKSVKEQHQKQEQQGDDKSWREEQRRDFFNGHAGANKY
jgi:hypothetical protein